MTSTQSDAFGAALRTLFAQAGRPTLEAAAKAASKNGPSLSRQRVSDWRNGRHIPRDYAVVEPLVAWLTFRAIDAGARDVLPLPAWRELWAAAQSGSTVLTTPQTPTSAPFRGLAPMTEADTDVFFGRTSVVAALVEQLEAVASSDGPRIVIVTGVSGAGKSSVLRAGLAAAPEPWNRPTRLAIGDDGLQIDRAELSALAVIDQFEGVFALEQSVRDDVMAAVQRLATNTTLILGIRADFFDACLDIGFLAEAWQHRSVIIGEMTSAQLDQVIREPIRLAGGRIDPGLAELLVRDLHDTTETDDHAGRLPLLAHTLERLWAMRSGTLITVATYRKLGGITSAIADTAEDAWTTIAPQDHDAARALLLSLVQFGPRGVPLRAWADLADLRRRFPDSADRIVDVFADARLITAGTSVTFIHDAVLTAWPRLATWVSDDADMLRWSQRLADDAARWADDNRDADLLYSGGRLVESLENVERLGELRLDVLPPSGLDFIDASVRRRRRLKSLQIGAVALIAILALVAGIAAVTVNRQAGDLEKQRNYAEHNALLSDIDGLVSSDPSTAARLALAADRRFPDDPAIHALLTSAASTPLAVTLEGHSAPVYDVAYSPDGSLLASSSNDRSVRIWRRTPDGAAPFVQTAVLGGFDNFATSVTFSPTLPLLAASSGDGAVRLWNVADPAEPRKVAELRAGSGTSYLTRFSPDGRWLATTSDDGTVAVYRIADAVSAPRAPIELASHSGPVRAVAFDSTSRLLASGGDDQTVHLWRVTGDDVVSAGEPIRGFPSITHSMAFLPGRDVLAVSGDSPTMTLWNVADPAAPRMENSGLSGVTAGSWSMAADPTSPLIALAGVDGVVHVWNVASTTSPPIVWDLQRSAARGSIRTFSVGFNPRGGELSVGRSDGGIDVWRIPAQAAPDRAAVVSGIAQSRSGDVVATVGSDTRLNVWTRRDAMWRMRGSVGIERRVNDRPSVAMSDDGKLVATANNNGGSIELWDISEPDRPRFASRIPTDTRYTAVIDFIPGRHVLVGGSSDTEIAMWDVTDAAAPTMIGDPVGGPIDLITAIAVDAAGTRVAITSDDRHVYVYDVATRERLRTIAVGTAASDVVFDPMGQSILVAADTLTQWSLDDGSLLTRIDVDDPDLLSVMGGDTLLMGTGARSVVAYRIGDDGGLSDRRVVTPVFGGSRAPTARWRFPAVTAGAPGFFLTAGETTGLLYAQSLDPSDGRDWICAVTAPLNAQEADRHRVAEGDDAC
ncbi:AAA family ATPase [Gordonia malaquae]|uniref:nSTAND1 domain-containing NTPase n=1 Tax=Gordonia malaquae TaxID=410332 RepID=UPI00301AA30F